MKGYTGSGEDAHFDRIDEEELERLYGDNDLTEEEYEEKLPPFLYINTVGEVAIGYQDGAVVTEEWNEWLQNNGIKL